MLISLVTLTLTFVFLKGTEAALLEPVKRCVPTATVRGPCHVCVCSAEGVFHCRPQRCQTETMGRNRPVEHCEPNFVYREDNIFCTCSDDGYWLSENCEDIFEYLHSRVSLTNNNLKTNVTCAPDTVYLIDCNICICTETGFIDITLCTNRYCSKGHKADSCTYGDVLRLDSELCACSDINYYIDRLCIKISDQVVQVLRMEDIMQLVDIGRSWRRLEDLQIDICDVDVIYKVDCNKCVCVDGHLACTTKYCEKRKSGALRHVNPNENLPELKSSIDRCFPGKKYRYKCNICVCNPDGIPTCTTMVCLDDFVIDIKSLRGALSNG